MSSSGQLVPKRMLLLGMLGAMSASMAAVASELEGVDAYLEQSPRFVQPARSGAGLVHIAAWDARLGAPELAVTWEGSRGLPTVPPSLRTDPVRSARWQLERIKDVYRLSPSALEAATETSLIEQQSGTRIVRFRQTHLGLPVFRHELKVLLNAEGRLVALGGNLHPAARLLETSSRGVAAEEKTRPFQLSERDAAREAVYDRLGVDLPASAFLPSSPDDEEAGGYRWIEVLPDPAFEAAGVQVLRPIRTRPGYYPLEDRLVPAWYLEVDSGDPARPDSSLYGYILSAETGEVLYRENLVSDVAFSYKVYADASGDKRPWAGPMADFAPHPTGVPDGSRPAFVSPVLVSMDGFNTTPSGTPDPWLASDATYTFGNNVEAYADHYLPDGYTPLQDVRATTTARRTFDRTYDVGKAPTASSDQIMAAVTDLFYTTNWMHDWWYDSGFTEAAGNAQKSNYGRGGIEGDPMHAEGQDQAYNTDVRNNANMSTPADGESPRMQMYLWTGAAYAFVDVAILGKTYNATYAAFGPTTFNLTGNLVVVNDGTGVTSDACETIRSSLKGKIALVDRGSCDFEKKAQNVQNAQAIGMIVVNNQDGNMVTMGDSDSVNATITIGSVGLSLADGTALKNLLTTQTVSVTLRRTSDIERDGTIDNSVVAHEWGHYLHKRLIPACTTTQCRSMGEGWSDAIALHVLFEEGDSLQGTYAMALYAVASSSFADVGYFGLRRAPYSIDFTKNALTFRHVQEGEPLPLETGMYDFGYNSEVHNAGEIWASMLWEVYAALQGQTLVSPPRYGYEEARRRLSDYIVAGMLLTPPNPTYTQQRDGILAAMYAADREDFVLAAEAFARRGAGTCAVSPPVDSVDQLGVVESFVISPSLELVQAALVEGPSCDHDGVLDAWEEGSVRLTLANNGPVALSAGMLTLESALPGLTFPSGGTFPVPEAAPYSTVELEVPVALLSDLTEVTTLDFELRVEDPLQCDPLAEPLAWRVNTDDLPASSPTETFESATLAWTVQDAQGSARAWRWQEVEPQDHHMRGEDMAAITDSSLVSPLLQVSSSDPLVLSFSHRYAFETGPATEGGPDEYWDGGVIEVSADDGQTWTDVSELVVPGYGGPIYVGASNPLEGRPAYTHTNPSYPGWDTVTLDFGTRLSNQNVRFRFRVGCDEAVGAEGWSLDNLVVTGMVNTPFTQVISDQTAVPEYAVDADGDTFGDPLETVHACTLGEHMSVNNQDCNDADLFIFPGAQEVCDGIDNNCDGRIDNSAIDAVPFYQDEDSDGYGSEDIWEPACTAPEGYVPGAGDCDDSSPFINPDSPEVCDNADNDCDEQIDDEPTDGSYYFVDADGDGYGSITTGAQYCSQPDGSTNQSGDCNDQDASIYYGAPEPADGVDHNCDGIPTLPEPTPTGTPVPVTPTEGPATPTASTDPETPTPRPEDTPTARPESTPTPGGGPGTPTSAPDGSPLPSATPTAEPLDGTGGCACSETQPSSSSSSFPLSAVLLGLAGLTFHRRRR